MTATLNGNVVGQFQNPGSAAAKSPSDNVTESFKFLAYKGLDSRMSGCLYYKAVGAVKGCDRLGNLVGAIRFDDWKRTVQIGPYALPGFTEYVATYVNKADLNLTRNHHSISYGPTRTAAYVCNHLGPSVLDPSQTEIDQVIDNAVNGKNLVACVAMDYMSAPGVNGGQPFVQFLIFGPSGDLLPSVNLDGQAEKFVSGTCVVCHGADHYTARFPETGAGPANIGAHFLPYDVGNFFFSSKPGLREADQEAAIRALNQNVLNAGPTVAAQELIGGWYANGTFDELPSTELAGARTADSRFLSQGYRDELPRLPRQYAGGLQLGPLRQRQQNRLPEHRPGGVPCCDGGCTQPILSLECTACRIRRSPLIGSGIQHGTAEDLPKLFDDFYTSVRGFSTDPVNLTCVPTRP